MPARVPLFLVLALLLPSLAGPSAAGAAPAAADSDVPSASRVLVRTTSASGRAAVRDERAVVAARRVGRTSIEVVQLAPGADAASVARRLAARPGIAWAEVDQRVRPTGLGTVLDDPHAGLLWGLDNIGQLIGGTTGAADVDVDAPEAWATTRGSSSEVVAVIDTGVDVSHPDLAANVWANPGEIPGNGIDDDGNGYVDDVHGWDFANDDASVYDDPSADAHGTHVAGTIAAVADNGLGVAGVAPGVTVMPLKFIGADGSGWMSDAVAALDYAASMGVTITNNSWGGAGYSSALSTAITELDLLVVAAAGNESLDLDVDPVYPAAFPHDTVVSVAALRSTGAVASYSNVGATTVDLGAPGSSILSTVPDGAYAYFSGTSMATPHVAGVAALVHSVAPELDAAGLASVLRATTEPTASLAEVTVTGGRVDADGALAAVADAPAPDPAPSPSPSPSPSPEPEVSPEPSPAPAPEPSPDAPDPTDDPTREPVVTDPLPEQPDAVRLAGDDRYGTSAAIVRASFPDVVDEVYVATGVGFADALAGTAVAAASGAPVLLVEPDAIPPVVAQELQRLSPRRVWVLGGTGAVSDGVVAALGAGGASVTRVAGPDRYATAAAASAATFAPGVPVAYVATGTSFPDALGAGAAAGRLGGPVLLTAPDHLPDVVVRELSRLGPARVVVLGGTGVVSKAVAAEVAGITGARVDRIGGSSRYETSAMVVADAFPEGSATVHVATGQGFADALAGGAAAAAHGAPVLLVPPSGPLPEATVTQLRRLAPSTVFVLGGVSALPSEVVAEVLAVIG